MESTMTESTISNLVQTQRNFFKTGATRSVAFRLSMLTFLKQAIETHEEAIYEALKTDLNKGRQDAFTTEIGFVYGELARMEKKLRRLAKPKRVGTPLLHIGSKSDIHYEPYGNVLVIAPWNYPFQLAVAPIIGAIAAGNTVVLKPSELTPNVSRVLREVFETAFHERFGLVIEGDADVSSAVLEEKFDYIFFTGSTRVGKIVHQAAAKHLTPVTLELGGKSPTIVHRDANLKLAAKRIAWGKWLNAGQTCIAPDYVFVHEDVREEFLRLIEKEAFAQYGNGVGVNSYVKIVSDSHLDRLSGYLPQGEILFGGQVDAATRKMAPTVMTDVDPESPLMQEEIFGPILPVYSYREVEEVIRFINDRDKPLALYLFTESKAVQHRVLDRVSFGGGCINDTLMHVAQHNLPFGGVGGSGIGGYHGKFSFETFSHRKGVVNNTTKFDLPFRYMRSNTDSKWMRYLL
ncbi:MULTISPECIES: aldehyde dehydrogenase [unclassified Exiguobacterium]|uniref:aldehyde dehydrogenase n=1 Tax=unclassified Exiguobacterium TaxID=2644629 RepID=UPI000B58F4A1|nr:MULTISPECIES: aldehyde dehydrogenase [unclassified Exiguobacterium]ASI34568.1 aldehyde dehydrogenase family protein [Exiguobacterium sp. N4-1P]